jgi:GTPase SAR1 family protein
MDKTIKLRSKCRHFRILVIGRANAGKTTILKKVCNSIDNPQIFSPKGKKVISRARAIYLNIIDHFLLQIDSVTVEGSSEVWLSISYKFTSESTLTVILP